jgi:hypothetical protein
MAESDHHRGVVTTAAARGLLEPHAASSAATTTTTTSSASSSQDEDEGFTFAAVPRPPAGAAFRDGRVYPVFGRPRSPPLRDAEDPATATALVPLGQLLLEERGAAAASSGQLEDDDSELDGVPAETYCLWSPGASPAQGSRSPSSSPARCRKSGSTGSVLRWRQRVVGRSHSDGKEKFVFLDASSDPERSAGRKSTPPPYKQDLVGFFATAGAFRRSYLPF